VRDVVDPYTAHCSAGDWGGGDSAIRHSLLNIESSRRLVSFVIGIFSALAR
jgi:hypothetical protein